ERGAAGGGAGGGRVSLDQAIDAYLDHVATERGLARKTVEAYARDLGAFTCFLVARGVRSAARIGATEVRAHLAALAEHGLSARSQARALAAVRGFTRFLVVRAVLADDVLRHLRIRRPPARRARGVRRAAAAEPAARAPEPLRLPRPRRAAAHAPGGVEARTPSRARRRPRPPRLAAHAAPHVRDASPHRGRRPPHRADA